MPKIGDDLSVRAAGFNLVTTLPKRELLDAADREGLKVMALPGTQAGHSFSAVEARRTIARLDRHPALWAWYLCDEPDLNAVDPEALLNAHHFLKHIGARKPTAAVLMSGSAALYYANITDILMLDQYPVPWKPLCTFPQHLRMARLALGTRKPLFAVIQAFDWRYDQEALGLKTNFRPPTYEEMRCMTYCALQSDAAGLFYYGYVNRGWRLPEHPECWLALQKIVGEVRGRLPLFQAEAAWWPFDQDYSLPESGWNESWQASVSLALRVVRRGNRETPAGRYVVAVNSTGRNLEDRMLVAGLNIMNIAVLGENRSLPCVKGWITDQFGPYAVHIYGPF